MHKWRARWPSLMLHIILVSRRDNPPRHNNEIIQLLRNMSLIIINNITIMSAFWHYNQPYKEVILRPLVKQKV